MPQPERTPDAPRPAPTPRAARRRAKAHPARACAAALLSLGVLVAGCGSSPQRAAAVDSVPDAALTGLLLPVGDVAAALGAPTMTAKPVATVMADNRNLLPNLNCLGIWQVNEGPIYDPSHWKSVRQQLLRTPDDDRWDYLAVQSVVSYRTPDGARDFFAASTDRWAKCTNHEVNIRLNDVALPKWHSGALSTGPTMLTIPYARGSGATARSCQRALAMAANLVVDVAACQPARSTPVTAAADIAGRIQTHATS